MKETFYNFFIDSFIENGCFEEVLRFKWLKLASYERGGY
jgi:hypothetical protein